jgi:Peptidase A4 family
MRKFNRTVGLTILTGALGLLGCSYAAMAQAAQPGAPDADSVCRSCARPYAQVALRPPANFNPVTASDAQLDTYGFPPRPDAAKSPEAYADWKHVVTLPTTRIVPDLVATKVVNGPVKSLVKGQKAANGITGAKSGNWSGYVVSSGADPFKAAKTTIFATFVVPVARQAIGECSSASVHSSEWVGLDGSGSADVLQAGIRAGATCASGKTTATYAAWYEWFPESEIDIASFPIAAGDLIYVYVWNTSLTAGHYYLADVTQNKSTSLAFAAPKGTSLKGNSAEWIVERPSIGGKDSVLTNYTSDPWLSAHVLLNNGTLYSPTDANGGESESLTMMDGSTAISFADTTPNNALSYVAPTGASTFWPGAALWFFVEGSAASK